MKALYLLALAVVCFGASQAFAQEKPPGVTQSKAIKTGGQVCYEGPFGRSSRTLRWHFDKKLDKWVCK